MDKLKKILGQILLLLFCSLVSYYLTWTIDKITLETDMQFLFVFIYFLVATYIVCLLLKKRIPGTKPKQNVLYLIVSGILSIAIIISCFDFFLGLYKPMKINITAVGTSVEMKEGQKGTEVWLHKVTVNNKQVNLEEILPTEGWENRDGVLLSYQNQPNTLTLEFSNVKNITMKFLSHPWSGTVIVDNGLQKEQLDLFNPDMAGSYIDLTLNGKHGLSSLKDYFLLVSCLVLLWGIIYIIIIFLNKKINLGGLIRSFVPELKHKIVYLFISFVSAFCLVGNTLLFNRSNVLENIFIFIIATFIVFILGLLIFKLIYKSIVFSDNTRVVDKKIFWKVFTIIVSIWCLYLIAYFPGFMSPDSIDQWNQAVTSNYNDWHPVIHTLIIKLLMSIWNNPALYSIVQIIVSSLIFAYSMAFLSKRGVRDSIILIISVLYAFSPSNAVYSITMWKDIPYSYLLLLLTTYIADMICNKHSFWEKSNLFLGIILFLTCTMRHNGVVVYVLSILFILYFTIKNRLNIVKPLLTVLFSITILVLYKGPVFKKLEVTPNPKGLKFNAPIHGIASLVHHEKDLSDETKELLEDIMPLSAWNELFYYYSTNPYLFGNDYPFLENISQKSSKDVISIYLKNLIQYPSYIIKDRLAGTDVVWSVLPLTGSYNYRYETNGIVQNDIGLVQQNNFLTKFINKILTISYKTKLFDVIFWRGGVYLVILLYLSFYIYFFADRESIWIFMPAIGNTISLFLSMSTQDYRYVWYLPILCVFIMLYTLVSNQEKIKMRVKIDETNNSDTLL